MIFAVSLKLSYLHSLTRQLCFDRFTPSQLFHILRKNLKSKNQGKWDRTPRDNCPVKVCRLSHTSHLIANIVWKFPAVTPPQQVHFFRERLSPDRSGGTQNRWGWWPFVGLLPNEQRFVFRLSPSSSGKSKRRRCVNYVILWCKEEYNKKPSVVAQVAVLSSPLWPGKQKLKKAMMLNSRITAWPWSVSPSYLQKKPTSQKRVELNCIHFIPISEITNIN